MLRFGVIGIDECAPPRKVRVTPAGHRPQRGVCISCVGRARFQRCSTVALVVPLQPPLAILKFPFKLFFFTDRIDVLRHILAGSVPPSILTSGTRDEERGRVWRFAATTADQCQQRNESHQPYARSRGHAQHPRLFLYVNPF